MKWVFDDASSGGGDGGGGGAREAGINKKRARDYHAQGRAGQRAPTKEASAALAALEMRRFKLVKRLRHQFSLTCAGLKIPPPLLAFERWLARAMLQGGDAIPTPMLPAIDAGRGLGRDLHRAGVEDLAAADAAASDLADASAALAAKLSEPPDADAADDAPRDADAVVTVDDAGPLLALKVNAQKPYMQVSKQHMGKLRALYSRHSLGGAPLPPEGSSEHAAFAASVFALLARYDACGGAWYQAALGEKAFDVLKKRVGVGCEAFASPLNARYGRFCSAFPDVDGPFGSLGSFFDFAPTRGSFEMNPPFVPEVLLAAAERAEKLLRTAEESDSRLSFVVVVPAWRDVPMWTALEKSAFKRGDALIVPASAHGYCDGAQQIRSPSERHRVSSYDTGVFFLQTTAGARRWPVTEEIRAELLEGMKAAVGSAATTGDLEKRWRGDKGGGRDEGGKQKRFVEKQKREKSEQRDRERGEEDGGGGEKRKDGEKRKRRRRKRETE